MFDTRIYTFLTLYEELNYSRTAEKLNMTQPGVTQHIKKVEEYYGVKLFEYKGRKLMRTRSADALSRYMESVIAEEEQLKRLLLKEPGLHLRVGATKTIGEFVIVPVVKRFLSNSEHTLDYLIDNTEVLLDMLERGNLDFAVIEGAIDKSRYGWHLFKKERLVGICSRKHPFAGKTVSFRTVLGETLLVREKGSGTRQHLERALQDRGWGLKDFFRTVSLSNFSVILDLLEDGGAITFAYEPIAEGREGLATFEVDDMKIEGEFNFVYTNREIAEKKIKEFFSVDE